MTRRRRDFWLGELSWIGLLAIGFQADHWSTVAGDMLLSVAFLLGVVPPVFYLSLIRRPEMPQATLPARPGVRKVNRSRQ